MIQHPPRRLVFLLLLFLATFGSPALVAQMPVDSGEAKPDGGRPTSTQVDFFEFLQSGGDAMLSIFQDEAEEPTIENPEWNRYNSPRATVLTFLEAMNHVALGRDEALPRALRAMGIGSIEDADRDDSNGDGDDQDSSTAEVEESQEVEAPEDSVQNDEADEDEAAVRSLEAPTRADDRRDAMTLLHIFDRLPELSPGAIPGQARVNDQDITRYELFPRGIDRQWAYSALGEAPNGSILLVKRGDDWIFDRETIDNADNMLESMRAIPPRSRLEVKGGLFLNIIEKTWSETSAGDWLFFVVAVSIGIAVAWGLLKLSARLMRWEWLKDQKLVPALIVGFLSPAALFVAVLGLAIGSSRIELHPALSMYRWRIIEALLILCGVWAVVTAIELACVLGRRIFFDHDDPYASMMVIVIRRTIRVVVAAVLILFIIQNVLRWNVASIFGGLAIVGLALSLAAKDAMKNLFGAITIFGNRPFIKHDWVKFDGYFGEIADVGLQTTHIRLLSGEMLAVPNMRFIDRSVENLSQREYLRRTMNVQITYDTPPEKVDEAIKILDDILRSEDIIAEHRGDMETYPPHVNFDSFGAHYLNLRVDYWYLMDPDGNDIQRNTDRGFMSYLAHCSEVNRRVLRRFNEAGIEFAFPTQTLYLADDPERGLAFDGARSQGQKIEG